MGRANRGKIKERLTEERKSNRELKDKVHKMETEKNVNWVKWKQTMNFTIMTIIDYAITSHMTNNLFVMAFLSWTLALFTIWTFKYNAE